MPGHDKSKIVGWNASDLDEFVCGICHDVLNKPVVTQCCRQSYCRDCIDEWLKGHYTCPNDRKPLTTNRLYEVPRLVINIINKMKIKCHFSDKGCPEVTTIGTKVDHYKICMYNQCKICGCCPKENKHDCIAYLKQENFKLNNLSENWKKEKLAIEKERSALGKSNKSLREQNIELVDKNKEMAKRLKQLEQELNETKSVLKNAKFHEKKKIQVVSPQFFKISPAVMEAKNQQPNVDYNRKIFPLSKQLIEICNESINSFDPSKHDDINFVECILSKIKRKKFPGDAGWKVKAQVDNCSVITGFDNLNDDDYNYDTNDISILRLSYDKLVIKISAYW